MHHAESTKIADLVAGGEIEGMYACARKEQLTARSGSRYLSIELRDATGSIAARVFKDAEYLAGKFDRGDIVRVAGRVENFRDARQLNVRTIDRVDSHDVADPRNFLPVAFRDVAELDGFLEHLAREVYDKEFRRLLDAMLADRQLRDDLRTAPCTTNGHHSYLGGLLEHTVAVTMLAQTTCELHRKLDSDLLLTAAILHDIGKTREFEFGAEIKQSAAGRMIGHLSLGTQVIAEWTSRVGGISQARELALLHCVVTHHGAQTSPARRFESAEALALFQLNAADAQIKGSLEHGALSAPLLIPAVATQ